MLPIITLFLFIVTTIIAFAIPSEDATLAEFLALSTPTSLTELRESQPNRETDATGHHGSTVQERSYHIDQFSYAVSKNQLITWKFGNYTRSFNISIASCVKMGDVAGVYQFANGSMKYDATVKDIVTDLQMDTGRGTRAAHAAQTLKNARLAYAEIQAFLSEDVLIHSKARRAINFQSEGRVLALVMKTLYGLVLGVATVEIGAAIAGIEATNGQLAAGALAMAGSVSVYAIIDLIADEGGLTGLEPRWMERTAIYVANVFMAQLRKLVMLARGAPEHSPGPRYTESELAAELGRIDAFSAWSETSPLSTDTVDIEGICDQV